MHIQPKRSLTPTKPTPTKKQKQPQINNKTQIQATSQTLAQKQQLQTYPTSRQSCQSPALTNIQSQLQSQIQTHSQNNQILAEKPNSDLQCALRIALETVEALRKQVEDVRGHAGAMQAQMNELREQCRDSQGRNKQLECLVEKYRQKYGKLKQKYKQLKPEQKPNLNRHSDGYKNEQQNINTNELVEIPSAQELKLKNEQIVKQVQIKNKTIQHLCKQIEQYEQNSQNILQLIDVLEQRVQQLTMDNYLLKGIVRQNQVSQADSNAGNAGSGRWEGNRFMNEYEKCWNVGSL